MKKYIKPMLRAIQNNNLFVKVFIVIAISMIAVTVLITFSTMRMSAILYANTFTIANTKALNQIISRFESFSYAFVNTTNSVENNGKIKQLLMTEYHNNLEEFQTNYDMVQQMERISLNIQPYDTSMIIVGKDGLLFNTNFYNWPVSWDDLQSHEIIRRAIEEPRILSYNLDISKDDVPRIVASKALTEHSTGNILGVLLFSIYEKQFKTFYEDYAGVGNDVLVLNEEGMIISSNKTELIGEKSTELLNYSKELQLQEDLDYKHVKLFDNDYMFMSEYLPTFKMYLVNLVDEKTVMNQLIDHKEIMLISVGIVSLAVIVLFIITQRMTKSLSKLVREISNLSKHNFNKKIHVKNGYEAKKIANAFNFMLNELHAYVDIVVQTQKKKRDAELSALQHQINPHFLYNTLASVKFVVQQGESQKATDMIHALISLLQSALGNIDQTITIGQELENTKNYVYINQARYGEQIKVNYFVSPDCLNCYVPKLVIQPFIENAFFHAFNKKKEGYIQILIFQKDDQLICEIIDNGDGMELNHLSFSGSMKEKRQLFSGIGIRNVRERIQLLYGNNYGVDISSELTEGTRIKITLPLMKERREEHEEIVNI